MPVLSCSTLVIAVWYATPKRDDLMNTRNFDWRTVVIILFVVVFLVGPFIRIVQNFLSIPPLNIATVVLGAAWLFASAMDVLRGTRATLTSTRVTYWRGERIEMRQPARARLRAASTVQSVAGIWYAILGLGCAYAATVMAARLLNLA
jgi:hypothetical protein